MCSQSFHSVGLGMTFVCFVHFVQVCLSFNVSCAESLCFVPTALFAGRDEGAQVWQLRQDHPESLEEICGPQEVRPNEGRRWVKKCLSALFVSLSASVSISFLCFLTLFFLFSALSSFWPAVESEGETATQPQQELYRWLPGYGWQAWASTVSWKERKDWLCGQSHKIRPQVQGWFSSSSSTACVFGSAAMLCLSCVFFLLLLFFSAIFRELRETWSWPQNRCTWLEEKRWNRGLRKGRWWRCWRGGLMWRRSWRCH